MNAAQRRRLAMYGLSEEDFLDLVEIEGGRCPICQRPFTATLKPVIDHDHAGPIRGLCCSACNYQLTYFRSDPAYWRRVAAYLEDPPARRLPGPPRRHRDAPPPSH